MPPPAASPSCHPASLGALAALAAALDPRDFATTMTARHGRPSCLTVTNRRAQFGDDIHADRRAYYWSWDERIGPINDPPAAARKVTAALRSLPDPTCG